MKDDLDALMGEGPVAIDGGFATELEAIYLTHMAERAA